MLRATEITCLANASAALLYGFRTEKARRASLVPGLSRVFNSAVKNNVEKSGVTLVTQQIGEHFRALHTIRCAILRSRKKVILLFLCLEPFSTTAQNGNAGWEEMHATRESADRQIAG
jgi:hypothetical protein